MKSEQDRLSRQVAESEQRLAKLDTDFAHVDRELDGMT